jgi:hypothetical protein
MCANHPDTPGTIREVPPGGPCRSFREKPKPVVRVTPPTPPNDKIRYIPLTKGKFAIVDAEDYEWLSQYKWHAIRAERGRTYYACRNDHGRSLSMHREIMKPPKGKVVDHENGNGADNRRANMRNCSQLQNSQNIRRRVKGKSEFRGVYRRGDKWEAKVFHKGKEYYLGLYDDPIEAAKVRDRKAYELAGEYAYLNFPEDFKDRKKKA